MYETKLQVNNNPPVADMGNVPKNVDEDEEISFDPTDSYDKETSSSELEYFWDFGDGTTSIKAKAKHLYTTQGTYLISLTVTDSDGTGMEVNTTIDVVNVKPQAKINVNKTTANIYDSLGFTSEGSWDTASDFEGLVYRWDFGDGTIEQDAGLNSTNHTYTKIGTYIIKLTVIDDDNANETSEIKVRINNLPDMDEDDIPDAIDHDDEESDMASSYILIGVILIIICIIVILYIFMRPKGKKKGPDMVPPPPLPDLEHTEEMETEDETEESAEPLPPPPDDMIITEPVSEDEAGPENGSEPETEE